MVAVAAAAGVTTSASWPAARLTSSTAQLAIDYLQLLWRVMDEPVPAESRRTQHDIQRAIDHVTSQLMGLGAWRHPLQLPRVYVPGLRASPWHHTRGGDGGPDAAPSLSDGEGAGGNADIGPREGELAPGFPQLAPLVALLEAAHAPLLAEYTSLRDGGALLPATECVHDARSGAAWRYYTSTGPWVRNRTADGCSVATPHACSLMRAVDALGIPDVRVLRVGWSAVGGHSVLRRHWGITNTQLKFHLGLVVPTRPPPLHDDGGPPTVSATSTGSERVGGVGDEGGIGASNASASAAGEAAEGIVFGGGAVGVSSPQRGGGGERGRPLRRMAAAPSPIDAATALPSLLRRPCAHLTVGGVTWPWVEGRALFFDDSFLHSVANECDAERVVFQLVISHPDYDGGGSGGGGGDGVRRLKEQAS